MGSPAVHCHSRLNAHILRVLSTSRASQLLRRGKDNSLRPASSGNGSRFDRITVLFTAAVVSVRRTAAL